MDGAALMPRLQALTFVEETAAFHPVLDVHLAAYGHRVLGDLGGLTLFGMHLERLPPKAMSSVRHWHETEDEVILMLSGEVILHEDDGETRLGAGDVAARTAGRANGHCLENRSGADAIYLTVGTRNCSETVHYPDHDRICHKDGRARHWTRRDGTPVEV